MAAHGLVKWEGSVGDKFFMERSGMKDAGYNGRTEGATRLSSPPPTTYRSEEYKRRRVTNQSKTF